MHPQAKEKQSRPKKGCSNTVLLHVSSAQIHRLWRTKKSKQDQALGQSPIGLFAFCGEFLGAQLPCLVPSYHLEASILQSDSPRIRASAATRTLSVLWY